MYIYIYTHIYIYIYIYVGRNPTRSPRRASSSLSLSLYIYIYVYRERERERVPAGLLRHAEGEAGHRACGSRENHLCIYIYIYMFCCCHFSTNTTNPLHPGKSLIPLDTLVRFRAEGLVSYHRGGSPRLRHPNCCHFSICARHPRAGAMLTFSVSFQF